MRRRAVSRKQTALIPSMSRAMSLTCANTVDGKPVLVVYLTRVLNANNYPDGTVVLTKFVQLMRDAAMASCQAELYLVGDQVWGDAPSSSNYEPFQLPDAVTNYDIYGNMNKAPFAGSSAVQNFYQKGAAWKVAANSQGVGYVPSVSPGYNDRGVRFDKNHPALSRQLSTSSPDGSLFATELLRARELVDSTANNLLLVNSFNEWHEDTQIEPCQGNRTNLPLNSTNGLYYEGYGELYLDVLRVATCDSSCSSSLQNWRTASVPDPFEGPPPDQILVGAF